MTRAFDKKYLVGLGLPSECDGGEIVADRIVGTTRWSMIHELTFRLPGQADGEAWQARYQRGATEYQDERPWDDDSEVQCVLVREVERTVKVWEPVGQ